jgi:LysM repeat protein
MGNLEKAGVLVVVALLAVILVVAFLNFPEQGKSPVLGASAPKIGQADLKKAAPKPEPANLYPPEPEIIRPKGDSDRLATDTPPRVLDPPTMVPPAGAGLLLPKKDDTFLTPTPPPAQPISLPKNDAPPPEEKKPASGWPKTVKVQSGESLWSIAVREYGAKTGPKMVSSIADANPKVRPEALKAGTELSLPAPPAEAGVASKGGGDEPKTPAKSTAKAPAKEPSSSKPARKLPFVPQ